MAFRIDGRRVEVSRDVNAERPLDAERLRLAEVRDDVWSWRRWGPYLSDRSWATVREDYSPDGNAWGYLPHDLARSKAYRWGEDGIAGWCDRYQLLCFAPAFWNGRDPILKERFFGLTPFEGNHGEDVKEYYFHRDALPSHAYMRLLYKYPIAPFPYEQLIQENQRRRGQGPEYELLDTGVFDNDRYFDIDIEYAKINVEELAIRITATNRGDQSADLHILAQLWFRNIWAWGMLPGPEPVIGKGPSRIPGSSLLAQDDRLRLPPQIPVKYRLGPRVLHGPEATSALFTDNETNGPRVHGPGSISRSRYVKDAFHRHLVGGEDCVNPAQRGTKAALHYHFSQIKPQQSQTLLLRFSDKPDLVDPLGGIEEIVDRRRREADEFYASTHPPEASDEEKAIQRGALAGLLWSKQSYLFDVATWLDGDDPTAPPPPRRRAIRNGHWRHLNSMRVMTMPDKWEYPWFATWDLAFQCVPMALVDSAYAKEQLWVLLFEQFQHPDGQLPAYEWEFSDLNPPVHAWAVWRVYNMDRIAHGHADRDFLERCFHKLLINFAWWVNKVDSSGNNVFEGGFLGLDNITVVDRSERAVSGVVLEQSDATGWMGMFCLNLMRIALELAKENSVYEGMAVKFFQHYAYVAHAMKHMGERDCPLWDEEDGFFYDVLRYPDHHFVKFRVRSLVGLIPLFAVERLERSWLTQFPQFTSHLDWFLENRQDLVRDVCHRVENGAEVTHVCTILDPAQLDRLLARLWDPNEFLSPFGVRSLSKAHERQPFVFGDLSVGYEPAEAVTKIKGGNSNWRGPIWFPTSFLFIESLRKLGRAHGRLRGVLTADGSILSYEDMARDLSNRLISLFRRGADGRRPNDGPVDRFRADPAWRDLFLFHEYFHADTGAGLGASHQTGWTALVASLIDEWRRPPVPSSRQTPPLVATPSVTRR